MTTGIRSIFPIVLLAILFHLMNEPISAQADEELMDQVEHHFAKNGDVKLHYVSLGKKSPDRPLIVMLHGFPDFWYTWRNQMPTLARDHYVVAMDLRGYNKSDQPKGVKNCAMPVLMQDVIAVIKAAGYEKAIVVGNDWGGAIAWNLSAFHPNRVEKLIICNLPHMKGLARELAINPQQQENSSYARDFQKPDAHKKLSPALLAGIVAGTRSRDVLKTYLRAFKKSDIECMLNYYKANYPRVKPDSDRKDSDQANTAAAPEMPNIQCPVLVIHGLKDKALLASALNDNWDWIDNELTILTLPNADHFVQQDAPERVTKAMVDWLGN